MGKTLGKAIVVIAVACGVLGFGLAFRPGTRYESNGAQLAVIYEDFSSLFEHSSLGVVGSFTGRSRAIDNPANRDSRIKILLQEFQPSRVLFGEVQNPIWVATYAKYDLSSWVGAAGQAVYNRGSKYLLFLSPSADGYYWTTGAWQGSFRIENDRVWSRYEVGESDSTLLVTAGMELEPMIAAIESLVSAGD